MNTVAAAAVSEALNHLNRTNTSSALGDGRQAAEAPRYFYLVCCLVYGMIHCLAWAHTHIYTHTQGDGDSASGPTTTCRSVDVASER